MFYKIIVSLLVVSLVLSSAQPAQASVRPVSVAAPAARALEALPAAMQPILREALSPMPAGASALGALASATATHVPTPSARPLVLARVQSAYTPGQLVSGTLIITYTLVNRLPLDMLSGAEVSVKLAPGVDLVSGPAYLTLADGSLSFALGEIGPADGASVSIVVSAPSTPGNLDLGARASASFANQRVSAQTAPARLISDAYAPFLGQQPEFMFNDVDLLEVAGLTEQDPLQAFALVRDATRWEAYRGSLRGARGTWWSEAGNALDRSSLLLGVLRTIGVPSRYMRGTLPVAQQRALIEQMFEGSASQMGLVSPQNQYDPYSDAKLLGIANDHWWVEADLGSGWQPLDVNFRGATVGALYGSAGQVVNSIPDTDRHWTKLALTVEHLPALTGPAGKLETFKAFEVTLPTAQIAGLPTVIGHFVRSTFDGGAVFYNIRHYYTPFIAIGGIRPEATIYRGDEYFEQITNFPLASQRVTAASYDVTIWGPDVPLQTYQDEVVDRIGKLARRQGGTVNSAGLSSTEPIVRDRQGVSLFVAPTWVPERAVARAAGRLQRQVAQAEVEAAQTRETAATQPDSEDLEQQIGALDGALDLSGTEIASLNGLLAMKSADDGTRQYAAMGKVRAYFNAPRLMASAVELPDFSVALSETLRIESRLNLMRRDIEVVAHPGQSAAAAFGLRFAHGVRSLSAEHLALAMLADEEVVTGTQGVQSAIGILEAAAREGIDLAYIEPGQRNQIMALQVSSDAKALMLSAVEDKQRFVIVPRRQPTQAAHLSWLEIDPVTGLIEDQDEFGGHSAMVEYRMLDNMWKVNKCKATIGLDQPGSQKVECKAVDARFAIMGFISGFVNRVLTRLTASLQFVVEYATGSISPTTAQRCAEWADRPCSVKDYLNFYDARLWFVISLWVRFFREANLGCEQWPDPIYGSRDNMSAYWSGIDYSVAFWKSKCIALAAKVGTHIMRGPMDLFAALFGNNLATETADWAFDELLSSKNMLVQLGFVSYDAAEIKLRVGGFDQGASVAGFLIKNTAGEDPDALPESVYDLTAEGPRPIEFAQVFTPAGSLNTPISLATGAQHLNMHRPSAFLVTSPAQIAWQGGETTLSNAALFDLSGALITHGQLRLALSESDARLDSGLSSLNVSFAGVESLALWSQNGSMRGQTELVTPTRRMTLTHSGPQSWMLGSGALVNGVRYERPVRLVISDTTSLWRGIRRATWQTTQPVEVNAGQGLWIDQASGLPGFASAVPIYLGQWNGGLTVSAQPSALGVNLSATAQSTLAGATLATSDGNGYLIQPGYASNVSAPAQLGIQTPPHVDFRWLNDAQRRGRVVLKPDQSAQTLSGLNVVRGISDRRTLLASPLSLAMPAQPAGLQVSVETDQINRHIWADFPYHGVMGLLHTVLVTYTATTSATFDVSVSGLPAGWVYLSRSQLHFARGGALGVGLVISPPVEALPLPESVLPFTVTVSQVSGPLVASASHQWIAPESGLPGVWFDPRMRTEVGSGERLAGRLFVFNAGAITDTFKLSMTLPITPGAVLAYPPTATVPARGVISVPVAITPTALPGQFVPVMVTARPGDLYTRTAMTHVKLAVVSVEDAALFERSYVLLEDECTLPLGRSVYFLAQSIALYRLGKLPLADVERNRQNMLAVLPPGCLHQTGAFTGTQAISTALTLVPTQTQPLVDALDLLSEQVEQALDYRAEISIAPALSAVRLNQPATLPVVLAHTGRISGTFTLVVTDALGATQTFTPFLAPGQRFTHTLTFAPIAEGEYTFSASANGPAPQIAPRAEARVLAYERLVDILAVRGTPNFVETGSSASALSVDVVNHTPLPQPVTIALTMTAPGGGVYYTAQVTRTLMRGVTNVPLGTATFINAPAGVYELHAELVGEARTALGGVSAGAGIRVETRSAPLLVPPGNLTATTWITTERTVYGSGATFSVGVPISGGVDLTVTVDAALHSSNLNPYAGVLISAPAGIYDIVYITGAVRWHNGGQWYGQLDIVDLSNRKYYILGHGVNTALGSADPFVGGLPTLEAAGAYHAGRFIRIRVTDTTTLAFYIFDTALTGSSANIGQITARVVQVDYPDNTLRRRMETAMHHATPRHALDAIQWDRWTGASTDAHPLGTRNRNCNGCHIQSQGIAGLSALNTKLRPSPVDERMMEWLSLRLRNWQDSSGWVGGYHSYPYQRTALPTWAWAEQLRMEMNLGRAPSPTVTQALTRAVNWLMPQYVWNNLWSNDHNSFPWTRGVAFYCGGPGGFSPMTTYLMMNALRIAYDLTGETAYLSRLTSAAIALATQVNWRGTCGGERYPLFTALAMLGLQEAVDVMTDTLQVQSVRNALAAFENDLRVTQQITPAVNANDGGWRAYNLQNAVANPSDPYVSAMALYALARQGVRSTDINLLRATEFLLDKQDWNYNSGNNYTSWRVGRWYSVYADSPVASTTWVDFAFPLIYERIGSYSLDVLHDTPAHARVLTNTFNLPPQSTVLLPGGEQRSWFYNQPETMRYQVISYTSVLTGLRPGEVRALTLGTLVTYTIESGSNRIALPGSYVQAVKIVQLSPAVQVVGAGHTARYTLTLNNPLPYQTTYEVVLTGLEDYGVPSYFEVVAPANGQVEQVITFDAPVWTPARQHAVRAEVNEGQDSDHALLQVVRDVAVALRPTQRTAPAGQPVSYTVVVSDLSGAGALVDVLGELIGSSVITLAAGLSLPPNAAQVLTWTLTAPAVAGGYALRVTARGGHFVPEASAYLEVVLPTLNTALGSATVGAGMPAVLTSTVAQAAAGLPGATLPGALITIQTPPGWQILQAPTHLAAGQAIRHGEVIVQPPAGTPAGVYDVTLTAVMTGYPQVTAQAIGRVTVLDRGVAVSVRPTTQTVTTGEAFQFEVLVTNTGTLVDRFIVSPTGLLASHTSLVLDVGGSVIVQRSVELAPGQVARFVLAGEATQALPSGLHPAPVQAQSVNDARVRGVDYGWLIVNGRPALRADITPTYQLVETPNAQAWLLLKNVGSAAATPVQIQIAGADGMAAHVFNAPYGMLLPQAEGATRLALWLPRPGRYVVTATASTPGAFGLAVTTATVEYRFAAAMAVADGETVPGQSATLPVSVTNLGTQAMSTLSARVSVPQGPWALNNVSAENGPVTVSLSLGILSPGTTLAAYAIRPLAPLPYGAEQITATVELLLNGEVWQTEQARVRVRAPDLRASALQLVGQQEFVHDVLTYTWQLRNTGDADALGAQAVVTLPTDSRFQWIGVLTVGSGTVTWDSVGKRLIWQGDLPAGDVVEIVFKAQASFGLPQSLLASPFEVSHAWRPTHYGQATYQYPYRVYFMLVRKNAP